MYENIGDNLHYLRYTRTPFYSQREVAQKLHVSKSTYARYEKGDLIPPLWFLHEVAAFYGIEVILLLSDSLRKELGNGK